jgi:hypothetical protein
LCVVIGLEAKKADLQTTLQRIDGAIQALEELLAEEPEEEKAEFSPLL